MVNRAGFDPKPYNEITITTAPKGQERSAVQWLLYGPDLAIVAEPEKPIRGVVTEADTGKPRAGVEVWLTREQPRIDLLPLPLWTKTDAEGRYEIRGARKAKS